MTRGAFPSRGCKGERCAGLFLARAELPGFRGGTSFPRAPVDGARNRRVIGGYS